MARYEVVIKTQGQERVIARTRRENGAINERDIAADSAYFNAKKHAEGDPYAHAVMGSVEGDPNAIGIVYFDDIATIDTIVTYRRVGRVPEPDLTPVLLASLVLLTSGARVV